MVLEAAGPMRKRSIAIVLLAASLAACAGPHYQPDLLRAQAQRAVPSRQRRSAARDRVRPGQSIEFLLGRRLGQHLACRSSASVKAQRPDHRGIGAQSSRGGCATASCASRASRSRSRRSGRSSCSAKSRPPDNIPFINGMTVQNAVAVAGGFTPRGFHGDVDITRVVDGRPMTFEAPLDFPGPTRRYDRGPGTVLLGYRPIPGLQRIWVESRDAGGAETLRPANCAFFTCFGRRSADCFAMSSTSPASRSRAAMTSAFFSTAPRAAPMSTRPARANPRPPDARRRRLPDPPQPASRRRHRRDARSSSKIAATRPDVVHGHGSKGGLYARLPGLLAPRSGPVRAYTPHGGSFNYQPGTPGASRLHGRREAADASRPTSSCSRAPSSPGASMRSSAPGAGCDGSSPTASAPPNSCPSSPMPDAADFLYVGELRAAKGIDTLLEALALAGTEARRRPARRAGRLGSGQGDAAGEGA